MFVHRPHFGQQILVDTVVVHELISCERSLTLRRSVAYDQQTFDLNEGFYHLHCRQQPE